MRRSANDWSARPSLASPRGARFRKICVSGQQDEPEVAPDEAAPRRRDGEVEPLVGGELVALLEPADLEPAEQVGGAERVAAVRERDDDALAGADERGELLLGLGEPARGDRRPLRLERVRLPAGERVEQRGAAERDRVEPLLLPDPRDRLGLEDEVGLAVERRHEVVRDAERARRRRGSSARRGRAAARPPGRRSPRSTGRSARCVNGEKARIASISSPNSSIRSGSRPVVGKTSTIPPRTANWPRSSTRSTRS